MLLYLSVVCSFLLLSGLHLRIDQFIHSSDDHMSFLQIYTLMHKASMSIQIQVLIWTYTFISHGETPRSGKARSYHKCLLNLETVSFPKATTLHPHKQFMRVLWAPHPHQHLILSIFLILTINQMCNSISLWL